MLFVFGVLLVFVGVFLVAFVVTVAFLALFRLFLFEGFFVGLDDFPVSDLAAPAFRFVGGEHGVAQEVLEVQAQTAALGAPQVAGLLEESRGVVLDDDDDAGQ